MRLRPHRVRSQRGWTFVGLLCAWLSLVGYALGPLAHEALVEHQIAERGDRVDVAQHDHEHAHSGTPAVEAACEDDHSGHACLAEVLLRAATHRHPAGAALLLGERSAARAPPAAGALPTVLLDLAPKTSPPIFA